MQQPKIPKLKNRQEVADFWGSHDITDYLHELEPIEAVYEPVVLSTKFIRLSGDTR